MDLAAALAGIYARAPLGMRLGLDPMRAACARLGHPERDFEVVHVAGTNGKGSVCAMVDAIARADGRKVGLYTSPHLCRFAERIRVGGEPLDDDTFARVLGDVLVQTPDLSFFETATCAAFVAFRDAGVELAVLEVGIGGRLDATNVVTTPRAAAITRVALDHEQMLGATLVDIAREKAGIAKWGLEIVLGGMQPDVRRAIDEVARSSGAHTVDAPPLALEAIVGLAGAHQRGNAAVAVALGKKIGASAAACEDGIAHATWPGRLERLETPEGPVLLDAAHNPDGAAALARHLERAGAPRKRTALVFGTLADKAWEPMLDKLAPRAAHRVYVAPLPEKASATGRASIDPHAMAARHPGAVASDVADACALARRALAGDGAEPGKAASGGLVVVAGSIYLVGQVRAHLLGLPRDPPIAL